MVSGWTCPRHGEVPPLHTALVGTTEHVTNVASRAAVPVWLPWPLPPGWLVTGVQSAGADRTGAVATVLACSGPNPVHPAAPGPADLLVVAEQPGTGLGAALAGLEDVDPGVLLERAMLTTGPHAKVHTDTQTAPLWHVPSDADRAAYVGEASGVWLWLLLWPATAGALVLDGLRLVDCRDPGHPLDLPTGALTPRLG